MKPAQAYCRLCDRLFCYFRVTNARVLCTPCVKIERDVQNAFLRDQRAAAKETA